MPGPQKGAKRLRIEAVAAAFNKSTKTIAGWANQGCNIFDPDEVAHWRDVKAKNARNGRNAIQSHGESEEAALNGHRRDTAGMLNMEILDKLPPPTGEGAAAALKRLQGLESIFYGRQMEALAKGRSDLISFALTDYRKITESLRMYEREVEAALRDSGQLISRGEAERGAAAVARWFRLGWRLWLSSSIPDLLPLASNPREFKARAEESFAEIMASVFAKAAEAKLPVPTWAIPAINEELRCQVENLAGHD
jgi:hypothetical protein